MMQNVLIYATNCLWSKAYNDNYILIKQSITDYIFIFLWTSTKHTLNEYVYCFLLISYELNTAQYFWLFYNELFKYIPKYILCTPTAVRYFFLLLFAFE